MRACLDGTQKAGSRRCEWSRIDVLSFNLCSSVTLNGRVSGSIALGSVRVSDHVDQGLKPRLTVGVRDIVGYPITRRCRRKP